MSRRVAIATTTIFPLRFLDVYADNIVHFGREADVTIYIAGDRRTPDGYTEAVRACRARGVDARFLTLEQQRATLEPFPELGAIIPENSDNRRNVAFLQALLDGAEVVISIDDDNFCLDGVDFVGEHLCVGEVHEHPSGIGTGGWYNACAALDSEPSSERLYPRGFPYRARIPGTDAVGGPIAGRVALNAGLWLLDPDCDAIGRLQDRPVIRGWDGRTVLLGDRVRCPVNTQNTALTREAMASYYYVRMGVSLRGLSLDRFGDILSGYFAQVCAEAVGHRVRIGGPLVEHRRHAHDLLRDLYHELAGIMMIEDISRFLEDVALSSDSYLSAYRTLSEELQRYAERQEGFVWTDEARAYWKDVGTWMRTWADAVERIG